MTKNKINIFLLSGLLLTWASCKKDDKPMHTSDAANPVLTASTASVSLDPDNQSDTVLSFHWTPTNFGANVIVNYTLELDLASDTSGAKAWGNLKSIALGTTPDSNYYYTGKDLNYLMSDLGVVAGTNAPLVARIKANIPQNTGAASNVAPVYSNLTNTTVLTYSVDMFVPGSFQGWDPLTAPTIALINGKPGLFECYVYISGTTAQKFKYISKRNFLHTVYGDAGAGKLATTATDSMSVPTGGYYELTANLNDSAKSWSAVSTTWGIIGDATPNGWNGDTQMTYDSTNQVWTVDAHMITAGSFKFRANGQWTIDFGVDASGALQYADNPFFGYNGSLNNITVPADGDYTITLDLHVPGKYTYTAVKH